MIRAVVHQMLKHLPEDLGLRPAVESAVLNRALDALLAKSLHERSELLFGITPYCEEGGQVRIGGRCRKRRWRRALPTRAPDPLGPVQVHQCVEDRRKAVATVGGQLLLRQRFDRRQQSIARPVVIVEERLDLLECHSSIVLQVARGPESLVLGAWSVPLVLGSTKNLGPGTDQEPRPKDEGPSFRAT